MPAAQTKPQRRVLYERPRPAPPPSPTNARIRKRTALMMKLVTTALLLGTTVGTIATNMLVSSTGLLPQEMPGVFGEPVAQYGFGVAFVAFLTYLAKYFLARWQESVKENFEMRDKRDAEQQAMIQRLLEQNNKLMEERRKGE